MITNRFPFLLLLLIALFTVNHAGATAPNCSQTLIDGSTPPYTTNFIYRVPVKPFYQWENNNGYCGEVAIMESGLNNGQWMSQFNARLICGTGLSQSGPDGACKKHGGTPNFNAQVLIEDPDTGVSGPHRYADAAMCLSNSRLAYTTFDYSGKLMGKPELPGIAGYQQYMSWVKQEVINGHQVGIALLDQDDNDPQQDHEVTVIKIGTNHSPTDPTYYPDDVLYFEDHGADTTHPDANPAIPPGASPRDPEGCTPYIYGYSFSSLANTRWGANHTKQAYSIVIPGGGMHAQTFKWIYTGTGGNGYDKVKIHGPHNFAFSVSGPEDPTGETLPVVLNIVGPTVTYKGVTNPLDSVAGFGEDPVDAWYENPMIGKSVEGNSCTNELAGWMTIYDVQATVSGLTPGVSYNLYEYDFSSVSGVGSGAALAVPVENFNAQAGLASSVTTFTATSATYTLTLNNISTSEIVVFRCVPVDAP
jgi:hypothetical protein